MCVRLSMRNADAVLMIRIGKWSDRMSCYLQFDRT